MVLMIVTVIVMTKMVIVMVAMIVMPGVPEKCTTYISTEYYGGSGSDGNGDGESVDYVLMYVVLVIFSPSMTLLCHIQTCCC